MTPRVKVSALQSSATAEDVVNLTRATGLSRFPVYRERIDEIVGMVHLKDALAVPAHDRLRTPVGRIARPALLVPETLPVRPLLARLRSEQPIAVVVDEYGGTAGVVTLEDIVEEIVGEVRDEHDGQDAARTRPRPARGRPPRLGRRRQLPRRRPAPHRPRSARRARTRPWPGSSPTCSAASPPPATGPNCPAGGSPCARSATTAPNGSAWSARRRSPAARRPPDERPPTPLRRAARARQRLLRRRRVRARLGAPQPDRTARHRRAPARSCTAWSGCRR